MKINEANLCQAIEQNNNITIMSDSNMLDSIYTSEYLLETNNPTLLRIRGGGVKLPTKLKNCAGIPYVEIACMNFFDIYSKYNDIASNPYAYIRRRLLPFDTTPVNTLSFEAGIASMSNIDVLSDIAKKDDGTKSEFSLRTLYEYVKNTDFSPFIFIRKEKEKFALQYNKDTHMFELRYTDDVNDNVLDKAVFSIYEYKDNKYQFKMKKIFDLSNHIGDPNIIEEFSIHGIGKSIAKNTDYSITKVDKDIDLGVVREHVYRVYVNKTPNYQYITSPNHQRVVYPYGIALLDDDDNYTVYNINDLICGIDNAQLSDAQYAFKGSITPTDIGGYHIFGGNYIFDMTDDKFSGSGNSFQVGALLIPPYYDSTNDMMIPEDVTKDNDNNCIVFNKHTGDNFNIRFEGETIYVKLANEVEYSVADIEDGHYVYNYTDNDGNTKKYTLGEKPLAVIQNDIDRNPNFIYEVNYQKIGNNIYRVLGNMHYIGGHKFYSKTNGWTVCSSWAAYKNTRDYIPYEFARVVDSNFPYSVTAYSDVTNRKETTDMGVYEIPGLIADTEPFYLKAFNYLTVTKDAGYPLNEFNEIPSPSLVDKNKEYNVLTWTIVHKGKEYDIAYISPMSDVLYSATKKECRCDSRDAVYMPNSNPFNSVNNIVMYVREHNDQWNNDWQRVDVKINNTTPAVPNGLNLHNVTPKTSEIIPGIYSTMFAELFNSEVTEYDFDRVGFSNILNKHYLNVKELGMVFYIDDLSILGEEKIEILKDKNLRGVKYSNGSITAEFTITQDENGRYIGYNVNINGDEQQAKSSALCLLVRGLDAEGKMIPNDEVTFIESSQNLPDDVSSSRPKLANMDILPEVTINYMFKQGIQQLITGFKDESDVMVDDSKFTIELEAAEEGRLLHVLYDGEECEFTTYVEAMNILFYNRPFLLYGEPYIKHTGSFKFIGMDKEYSDKDKFISDVISKYKGHVNKTLYTTPVNTTQNPFMNFKFTIDPKIIAYLGEFNTEIPRYNKVELNIELGVDNSIETNLPMIERDFIYSRVNGYVTKNYTDTDGNEKIEYYAGLTNTMLKRQIEINPKEQTSIMYDYYSNAKAQLIQDLREDTISKRIEGASIDVSYDMQRVYKSIHTFDDTVWNIPTAFVCDDTAEEAVLNKIRAFSDTVTDVIEYADVILRSNKTIMFVNNSTSQDKTLTVKVKNTNIFNGDYGYDFTNIHSLYNNKMVLVNWFTKLNTKLDENFLTEGSNND